MPSAALCMLKVCGGWILSSFNKFIVKTCIFSEGQPHLFRHVTPGAYRITRSLIFELLPLSS